LVAYFPLIYQFVCLSRNPFMIYLAKDLKRLLQSAKLAGQSANKALIWFFEPSEEEEREGDWSNSKLEDYGL
jgi:hypothetical protein